MATCFRDRSRWMFRWHKQSFDSISSAPTSKRRFRERRCKGRLQRDLLDGETVVHRSAVLGGVANWLACLEGGVDLEACPGE